VAADPLTWHGLRVRRAEHDCAFFGLPSNVSLSDSDHNAATPQLSVVDNCPVQAPQKSFSRNSTEEGALQSTRSMLLPNRVGLSFKVEPLADSCRRPLSDSERQWKEQRTDPLTTNLRRLLSAIEAADWDLVQRGDVQH